MFNFFIFKKKDIRWIKWLLLFWLQQVLFGLQWITHRVILL